MSTLLSVSEYCSEMNKDLIGDGYDPENPVLWIVASISL